MSRLPSLNPLLLLTNLNGLQQLLPTITTNLSQSIPKSSPLHSLFTTTIPTRLLSSLRQFIKTISQQHTILQSIEQKQSKIPIKSRLQLLRQVHKQSQVGSSPILNQKRHYSTTSSTLSKSNVLSTKQPYNTHQRSYSQQSTLSKSNRSSSLRTKTKSHTKNNKFTPQQSKSLLTTQQRSIRFRRYTERGKWSFFHFFGDIFSPVRTIYNWLRPLQWKARRFLPGRFIGYIPWILTCLVYSWIVILFLERNRQFDAGWTNPEGANFGYFTKRDWVYAAPKYDVEIFMKRKKYKKMDGNKFIHEEDLKRENQRPQRWHWMFPHHVNRYATPRGIWPLRSYVINSPQYVDRRYLSRGYRTRQDKFAKWTKGFMDQRLNNKRKKRALRLRGGKYEYGGTAQHYYFTRIHDEVQHLKGPRSELPMHSHQLNDAAKY